MRAHFAPAQLHALAQLQFATADNQGTPIKISKASDGQLAFEGDKFRPILEEIDATVKDTKGRSYPGNALRNASEMISQCYNENEVHLIRITDSCPCTQVGQVAWQGVTPWAFTAYAGLANYSGGALVSNCNLCGCTMCY